MDKKDVLIHLLQFKGDNTATEILLRELRDFTIRSINKDAKDQFNGNRNHLLTEDDCPPIIYPAHAKCDWDKSNDTVRDVIKENTPDEIGIEYFCYADKVVKVRSNLNTLGYYYCTKSHATRLGLEIISE